MHTHLHRTPQPNTFPSFTPKNTSRMVREPHRTHGNKTRISSFTDSRTTICALCHTPTPMSTLSPLVFLCSFTPTFTNSLPQRVSPLVIRVTALPQALVCHTRTIYHPTPLPRSSASRVSLFRPPCDRIPVTPPEPGPAPSPASGFRPSGLPTPVSPGVPTGARNLGVCVFSCFALTLCYCLSVFSFSISLFTSVTALSSSIRFCTQPLLPSFACCFYPSLTLCYRSLILFVPPSSVTAPPTFVYSFFSRTLVFPSHTSYEPHGSSASPVWDLRRRWVMLTVCTETELVPTGVLSSHFSTENFSPRSFILYSSLPTYNNTV